MYVNLCTFTILGKTDQNIHLNIMKHRGYKQNKQTFQQINKKRVGE